MLNPWRLRLLVDLRTLGTMHAVARATRLSPSTVSQQLAALEKETGSALLERSGRRVRLTEAGDELARRASGILDGLDALGDWVRGEHRIVRGRVRIAAFASVLAPVVIPAMMTLRSRYPELELSLTEEEPDESIPALARGEYDVVLSARFDESIGLPEPVPDGARVAPLLADSLVAVLPSSHRLARSTAIPLRELSEEVWVVEPPATYLTMVVERLAATEGFAPRIGGVFSSHDSLLRSVAAGLAISVLPGLATRQLPSGAVAVPLTPSVLRRVEAVTRPVSMERAAVRAVLAALGEEASGWRRAGNHPATRVSG